MGGGGEEGGTGPCITAISGRPAPSRHRHRHLHAVTATAAHARPIHPPTPPIHTRPPSPPHPIHPHTPTTQAAPGILAQGAQLVCLGTGSKDLEVRKVLVREGGPAPLKTLKP